MTNADLASTLTAVRNLIDAIDPESVAHGFGVEQGYQSSQDRLTTLRNLADLTERAVAEGVAVARADGASWGTIGAALGVSRQSAHERYAGRGA
jgi:hypothetical protein